MLVNLCFSFKAYIVFEVLFQEVVNILRFQGKEKCLRSHQEREGCAVLFLLENLEHDKD